MINDVHVHMGHWQNRHDNSKAYYSPDQVWGYLNQAKIDNFCVSSTSSIKHPLNLVQDEHREMEKLATGRCYHLLWIRDAWFDADPNLNRIASDIPFAGIKLHNEESDWLNSPIRFRRILAIARERSWAVQVHTGGDRSDADLYLPFCKEFPEVHFDLAHARPARESIMVAKECPNVFLDCSFASEETIKAIIKAGLSERLIFGTDLPILFFFGINNFKEYVESRVKFIRSVAEEFADNILERNFVTWLGKK